MNVMAHTNDDTKIVTLGAGSFWCMEAIFNEVKGVINVTNGYSGGIVDHYPPYHKSCSDIEGCTEVVQIEYSPSVISYEELLTIFMTTHNPTELNRKKYDDEIRYQSIIFYENIVEKATIDIVLQDIQTLYSKPIITKIQKFKNFIKADASNQHYYNHHRQFSYCNTIIEPVLYKFRKQYPDKLKEAS